MDDIISKVLFKYGTKARLAFFLVFFWRDGGALREGGREGGKGLVHSWKKN